MRHQPPSHLLSLLSLVLLLRVTSASDRCPVVLNPSSRTPRIVGGDLASNFSASFTASLFQAFASTCTGSLLSPRWVLTARHCLPSNATFVFLGGLDRTSGALIPVRRAYIYSTVPLDQRDDIALIELASPAPKNSTFVRVNMEPNMPSPGAFVRSIGYGTTAYAGPDNKILREVDFPAVSTEMCNQEYVEQGMLDGRTLCAGYEGGRCGVCNGDSGGPLVQFDEQGRPVQVGIVSRSRGCAWAGAPAIFTRVSAFVDWMEEVGAEFERADDAVQTMQATPVDVQEPNAQEGAQTRVDDEGDVPKWAVGVVTGGPLLAVAIVAAVVLAVAKISRDREGKREGAESGERAVRDGDDGAEEDRERREVGEVSVEAGTGVEV